MSKGSIKYQEILRNKKGIIHSKTKKPANEFITWLKEQGKGFKHRGNNYISTIMNGFVVRYDRWSNDRMVDIKDIDGTLLFVREHMNTPIKPIFGHFKNGDKFADVIKVQLREKKLLRVLQEFGFEDEED